MYGKVIEAKTIYAGRPRADDSYTKAEAMELLPVVGDVLTRTPNLGDRIQSPDPVEGKVIHVNREHLWYMIQFESGFRQCFKVPEPEYLQ